MPPTPPACDPATSALLAQFELVRRSVQKRQAVAEHLGRLEAHLEHIQRVVDHLRGPDPPASAAG